MIQNPNLKPEDVELWRASPLVFGSSMRNFELIFEGQEQEQIEVDPIQVSARELVYEGLERVRAVHAHFERRGQAADMLLVEHQYGPPIRNPNAYVTGVRVWLHLSSLRNVVAVEPIQHKQSETLDTRALLIRGLAITGRPPRRERRGGIEEAKRYLDAAYSLVADSSPSQQPLKATPLSRSTKPEGLAL